MYTLLYNRLNLKLIVHSIYNRLNLSKAPPPPRLSKFPVAFKVILFALLFMVYAFACQCFRHAGDNQLHRSCKQISINQEVHVSFAR